MFYSSYNTCLDTFESNLNYIKIFFQLVNNDPTWNDFFWEANNDDIILKAEKVKYKKNRIDVINCKRENENNFSYVYSD